MKTRKRKVYGKKRTKRTKRTKRKNMRSRKIYRKKQYGGENSVIMDYLNDLYENNIPSDLTDCYFKCNLQLDSCPVINEKYKRANVNVSSLSCVGKKVGRDAIQPDPNNKCFNRVNPAAIIQAEDKDFPKKYFETKEHEGNPYFKNMYLRYFGKEYEPAEWNSLKNSITATNNGVSADKESHDNTIIILGPAELLYPFSSDEGIYNVLSHAEWTPNVNFNYIIDVLCKKGEFFFVLPTGSTNSAIANSNENRFTLASDCKSFVRATLSELLVVKELEQSGLVTVTNIVKSVSIPNIFLEASGKGYEITMLHVKTIDNITLCADTIINDYPIDYMKK
jgi:hypothetical protein